VKAWREAQTPGHATPQALQCRMWRASAGPDLPAQLVARWLGSEQASTLPLAGDAPSFTAMAEALSTDVHPRALLTELERQGVVQVDAVGQTLPPRSSSAPAHARRSGRTGRSSPRTCWPTASATTWPRARTTWAHHRLSATWKQGVFADGLSRESVDALERLSTTLWMDAMARLAARRHPTV